MTKSAPVRSAVLGVPSHLDRLLRRVGTVACVTWQGCQEEGLPPVRRLRRPGWLGQARISGEHTDPCDVQNGTVMVPDWRTACTAHGGKDPVANEYFGLPEDWIDPDDDSAFDRAVDAIAHLPVVLLSDLDNGMEEGLARTQPWYQGGGEDQWSLIEAYVRLGMVPPASILSLPHTPDPTRSDRLTAYLIAAYLRAACHVVTGDLRSRAQSVWRLLSKPDTPVA